MSENIKVIMKIILITMAAFIFLSSCSIFNNGESEYYKKKVYLLDEKDYKESILFIVYTKDSFELQVPLIKLTNYVYIENEEKLTDYFDFINSIIKSEPKSSKINTPLIGFAFQSGYYKYGLLPRRLFESGDYKIYNTKSKTYIKDVIVELDESYSGPMAASISYWVFINGYKFWGFNHIS